MHWPQGMGTTVNFLWTGYWKTSFCFPVFEVSPFRENANFGIVQDITEDRGHSAMRDYHRGTLCYFLVGMKKAFYFLLW